MTCILYREGKGTIEFGIECESTTCEVEHLEGLISAGWSANPPGYAPSIVEQDAEAPAHPVRAAAKEAGLEGWDTKRIATLQKDLEA